MIFKYLKNNKYEYLINKNDSSPYRIYILLIIL